MVCFTVYFYRFNNKINFSRFQIIVKLTKKIDWAFFCYLPVFIGVLFFAIIYYSSRSFDSLRSGNPGSEFIINALLLLVSTLILFYGLRELSEINVHSSETKTILYEYLMNVNPEDRTTTIYEEVCWSNTSYLIFVS